MTGESTPPLRSISEPRRPSDTDRMDDQAKRIHPANAQPESDPASADPNQTSSNPGSLQVEPNSKSDTEAATEET